MATKKPPKNPELGRRLQLARLEAGYSQEKFAKVMGVTKKAIGENERGIAVPTPEHLKKFAELTKVPLEHFTEVI